MLCVLFWCLYVGNQARFIFVRCLCVACKKTEILALALDAENLVCKNGPTAGTATLCGGQEQMQQCLCVAVEWGNGGSSSTIDTANTMKGEAGG